MIKRLLDDIAAQIKDSSYNFFSVKAFFGFDDVIRLIKIIHIFFSFILNLLIVISLLKRKRKRKKNSIGIGLTGNILIINFLHTFAYILNWVVNIDKGYTKKIGNNTYKIGGLLIGNPKNNYTLCQIQGFLILYSSLSQDISIIIFFFLINMSNPPTKLCLYSILLAIGHFYPFFYATFFVFIDGIGLNDRYCYIKKFEYKNNDYDLYDNFRILIIVTYSLRAINLIISIFLLVKINKYVKKQKLKKIYILKTYFILILQVITISIGFIYRISHLIANDNNKSYSSVFLCINTIDGILFPIYYCLSNDIFTNLFCKNNFSESLYSMRSEDNSNNRLFDDCSSNSSHPSNKDDITFSMVDVKDENNFEISYYNEN